MGASDAALAVVVTTHVANTVSASIRSVTHFPADVIVAWSIVCSIAKARVNLGAGTRLSEVVCNGLTLPKPQFKYHITHR